MTTTQILILTSIIVYLIATIAIGVWSSRKNETTEDFYLGGRKLGPIITAMSAEASDMSSYLLMGVPGVAYVSGLADATWTIIGLAVGTYLNWLIVAKRLRIYTVKANNSTTVPEFISNRFGDDKKILAVIAAAVIIIFFVPYTASGFSACGKLFSTLFGMNYLTAMIISAIVIVAYTTLGGFLAASTTDFIQSIIMTFAILTVLGFGVATAGGFDNVKTNAQSMAGYLSMVQTHTTEGAASYGPITILSTLAWGLGYFGMPHILLRFMAIEDHNKIKLSRRIATIWVVISMAIAVGIGITGRAMSEAGTIPELADGETVLIEISQLLASHGALAAIIAGVILAGILAATMSTADSQLLAAASSVSKDILNGVFLKNMSEKTAMLLARITVLVISIIAMFIARDPNSSVFGVVSFAWAGFGAAFGPVILTALFWRRTNRQGALAGMVCGGVMVFVWKFLVRPMGGAWNIYELLPAFIVALAAIIIVSLLTKAPAEEITEVFDDVKKELKA